MRADAAGRRWAARVAALPRAVNRVLRHARALRSRFQPWSAHRLAPSPALRRWAAGAAALALAASLPPAARAAAGHPAWIAAAINTGEDLGLVPYRAVAFRRRAALDYPAVTVSDPALAAGSRQVRRAGEPGAVLQSGLEFYRTRGAGVAAAGRAPAAGTAAAGSGRTAPAPAAVRVLARTVVAPPRRAVVAVGTSRDEVDVGGHDYHYSRAIEMTATAYDDTAASNGPWTGEASAIGLPLAHGIAAVDPRVIPLGSRLYVEQYGLAIAADTGSAIVGDRIDLFFFDTPSQTAAFGERRLMVYVIDDPRLPPVPVPASLVSSLE